MIYTSCDPNGRGNSLDDLEKTVRITTKALRPHLDEFDVIAVTGMSGVLVGSPAALRLRKPLVVVRKPGENHHDGGRKAINERYLTPGARVLFLDDFVCGGETRDRVMKAVGRRGARVVADFLYSDEIRRGEGYRPHPEPKIVEETYETEWKITDPSDYEEVPF